MELDGLRQGEKISPNSENLGLEQKWSDVSRMSGEISSDTRRNESIGRDSKIATPSPVPNIPQVVPVANSQSSSSTPGDNVKKVATPDSAADEDLIEKEWVDKAKSIISETQGDPRLRELRISELRRDYIKKRYGDKIV